MTLNAETCERARLPCGYRNDCPTPYIPPLPARITIITNNYWDIPLRFGQALTIAIGHDRDCYVQFEYSCKQLYHVEKFFKINIGPKELINSKERLITRVYGITWQLIKHMTFMVAAF